MVVFLKTEMDGSGLQKLCKIMIILLYFLDLKNCPQETLKTLPKENLLSILNQNEFILSYYNPFKIFKKKFLTFSKIIKGINSLYKNKDVNVFLKNNEDINFLRQELLEYTKSELTTSKLAKYVIEKSNNYFKE